jgi:hypothetical protein
VNNDGRFGRWTYHLVWNPNALVTVLTDHGTTKDLREG